MAALVDILAAGVVDEAGEPLVNGVVYFYERGTTTKVTVYQDSDLTIPYSNPLTLDAAGKAEVYIQNPVRVVVEDSDGNLIDDIANVGEVATLGADLIIGTDSNNYVIINSKIRSDLIPDVPSFYLIGNQTYPWKEIHLDGDEVHGGRVYFNAATDAYIESSTDGTTFTVGGFAIIDFDDAYIVQGLFGSPTGTVTDTPQIIAQSNSGDAIIRLEVNNDPANAWDLRVDNSDGDDIKFEYNGILKARINAAGTKPITFAPINIGGSTATAVNHLYANLIPKAWVKVAWSGSTPSKVDAVGVSSVTHISAGVIRITLYNTMANANYVPMVSSDFGTVPVLSNFTTTTFDISMGGDPGGTNYVFVAVFGSEA